MKSRIAIGTIIFFLGCVSLTNAQSNQYEIKKAVKNAVEKAKEIGMLTRIDTQNKSFYIKRVYWFAFNSKQKENTVRAFARYFGYFIYDMDSAVGIYVKDNQSGKTLATYGVWEGVVIK